MDPLTKQIKAITGKRKKVDADYEQLEKLEFIAGLYANEEGPVIPRANLRKMLIEGGRKSKEGKDFEAGTFVFEDAFLEYDGPRDTEGLFNCMEGDKRKFVWTTVAGNQRASIMRTRPRFDEWSCEFDVEFEDSLMTLDKIQNSLDHGRFAVGICDARSLGMGRFAASIL